MAFENGVIMQYFHWYIAGDGSHWNEAARHASELSGAGITAVWLPPAYKGASGGYDVGYGVYDIYDLGEFEQKGSVRTKYGTKDQYVTAVAALQRAGLQVYGDVAVNHRMGGDGPCPLHRPDGAREGRRSHERVRLGRVPMQRRLRLGVGAGVKQVGSCGFLARPRAV
jgi:hypothetical protein